MFCSINKKIVQRLAIMSVAICALFATSQAQAHDLWINASASTGSPVEAYIGYGHDFPNPEPIAEARLSLFKPLELHAPEGNTELKQKGENYAYTGTEAMKKGSYIVTGCYVPTFWSKGPGGWAQKNRQERPDATYCEEVSMFGKTIMPVGGDDSSEFVSQPIGQRLEIVPLVHPSTVKAGGTLPVQVLLDGKPLKIAEVAATYEGFSKNKEHKAFQGRCNLKGIIEIVTLKEGYWFAKVKHVKEKKDKSLCDEVVLISTLTFHIGK